MRRPVSACLFVLALAGTALCGPTLKELDQDAGKKKELDKGRKALDKYFKTESDLKKGRKSALAGAMDEARDEFLAWLASTGTTMGLDLRAQPDVVIDLIDGQRLKYRGPSTT
jgi:hypothetical protein